MTTEIVTREDDKPAVIALLNEYRFDVAKALPEGMTADRFKSVCRSTLRANPTLLTAEPMTFISSVLLAAQLGLEPGAPLGLSWIIPRRNKGRMEASFQIGYQGLRQLAYRSGAVKRIEARIVFEGDEFDFSHGMGGTDWKHKPSGVPGREWTDVYCVAETAMGAELFDAMTKGEVIAHRDRYSPEWQRSKAWKEQEPEMGRKIVTARLCRQLPMSVEFRQAMVSDGASPRELVPDLAGVLALEVSEELANFDDVVEVE